MKMKMKKTIRSKIKSKSTIQPVRSYRNGESSFRNHFEEHLNRRYIFVLLFI